MNIEILDTKTGELVNARIEESNSKLIPMKKDGWQFNWRSLYKTEGSIFYNIFLEDQPNKVEGMIMMSLMNDEMMFANNIEVAPWNLGSSGRYDKIAGCLIAFGCLKSFELGMNHYKGFLTFDSKSRLIDLYESKYRATHAMGQKMFIEPQNGLLLIEEYLNLKL